MISIAGNKGMVTNTSFTLDKQPTITQWRKACVLNVKGWKRHSFPAQITVVCNYRLQHWLTVMETWQSDGRTLFCPFTGAMLWHMLRHHTRINTFPFPIFHIMTLALVSKQLSAVFLVRLCTICGLTRSVYDAMRYRDVAYNGTTQCHWYHK